MNRDTFSARLKDKRGTVTVVVVLAMLALIGFAAFAIDVGYMMVSRNQLQNIADTAALAAAGELGASYEGMQIPAQREYRPDAGALLTEAQSVASRTGISGVTILSSDFRLGTWNFTTHTFTPSSTGPTAVNVTARKDNVANGPVTTLLAGVLGMGSFNVSATATASLAPPNYVPSGGLPVPVGISLAWFSDPAVYCNKPIKLYPANDPAGCAGWHVYDQTPSSANTLRNTIDALNNGTYVSPETITGVTQYDFTGGNIANALRDMTTLFNTMKVKNDGILDKDNDSSTWTTAVPVYDSQDCSNPHGTMMIVGFSTIVITSVTSPPAPQVIWAKVVCDSIVSGPGGGGLNLQTYGTKPNLVQENGDNQ
jgi:Flp pilus assembly protein TadG